MNTTQRFGEGARYIYEEENDRYSVREVEVGELYSTTSRERIRLAITAMLSGIAITPTVAAIQGYEHSGEIYMHEGIALRRAVTLSARGYDVRYVPLPSVRNPMVYAIAYRGREPK